MPDQENNSLHFCAVTDARAGNIRQAEALAGALSAPGGGTQFKAVRLQPGIPWRWFAPHRLPGDAAAYGPDFSRLLAAPPEIAIGCGRQAALATRLLRARGSKTVQILDPRLPPRHWDWLVVPEHDGLRGANVLTTLGGLNPVDDAWLAAARARFARFAELPRPRIAMLLGGRSAHARFDRMGFEVMAAKLEAVLDREGGSILATTSRRSDALMRRELAHRYDETPGVIWRGPDDGENPYAGLLAWADRIVCSPDSVNMISEACATAAPVFVFDPERVRGRPRRFLDALLARGRIRRMDARLTPFEAEPLRETARVAALLHERLRG